MRTKGIITKIKCVVMAAVMVSATLSVPTVAKADGETVKIYDAGVMTLTSVYQSTGESHPSTHSSWRVTAINSTVEDNDGKTVSASCENTSIRGISSLSAVLVDEDGTLVTDFSSDEEETTDYLAPWSDGNDYYYVAEGIVDADETAIERNVTWKLFAWPQDQGWSYPMSITTKAQAETEYAKILTDINKEWNTTVSFEDTGLKFGSLFGLARPRWESGNVKYDEWVDETGITSPDFNKNVFNDRSLVWDGNGNPWISFDMTNSKYTVVRPYSHKNGKGIVEANSTNEVTDEVYGNTVSETAPSVPPFLSRLSSGINSATGEDKFDTVSNGTRIISKIVKAMGANSTYAGYLPSGTSSPDFSVAEVRSVSDQVKTYWKNRGSQMTSNIGEPKSWKMNGYWFKCYTGGTPTGQYVFSCGDLNSDTQPSAIDITLSSGGTDKIDVYPIYDVTYEYSRAAGIVNGKFVKENISSVETTDASSGNHFGYIGTDTRMISAVTCGGLKAGQAYIAKGQVCEIGDSGTVVPLSLAGCSNSLPFIASSATANIDIECMFDSTTLLGKELCMSVELYEAEIDLTGDCAAKTLLSKNDTASTTCRVRYISPVEDVTYINEDGENAIPVTAYIPATYTVSIPAQLALNYNKSTAKYEGKFAIGAMGSLANDDVVFIRPNSNNISLTGEDTGGSGTAELTQSCKTWGNHGESRINASSYTNKNGTVVVDLGNATDTFKGSVSFTFGTEFAPSDIGDQYTGADVLDIIRRYTGKTNFSVKVDNDVEEVYYICEADGTALESDVQTARYANAKDKNSTAYINPADKYYLTDMERASSGANEGSCTGVTFTVDR